MFYRMPKILAVLIVALGLTGCATLFAKTVLQDISPEAKGEIAKLFIQRCGGTVNIGATGATGQLGGAISADYRLAGTCPVPEAPVTPIKKFGLPPAAPPPT